MAQVVDISTDIIRHVAYGRLGDFIYQLSVINENFLNTGKKGLLYIRSTPEPFAYSVEKTFNDTKDYINTLSYISDYKIYNGEAIDIDLSIWRNSSLLFRTHWNNIFKQSYNIDWGTRPWLVSTINPLVKGKILFSCSINMSRYPYNINFLKFFESFGIDNILFITQTTEEYNSFTNITNIKLPLYVPESITDYISAINSCECFIGNLSSPLTYAYGLHKKCITLLNQRSDDNIHVLNLDHIFVNNTNMVTFN